MEDVSIMKKTTLLLSTLITCAMGMSVAQATQTVSLGYAQAKVEDFKDLKGVTAKYHYQGDSALGIIGSFTYLGGKKDYNQSSIGFSSHESDDVKYYSLMVGPSYQINDVVSIYGLAGLGHAKVKNSYNYTLPNQSGNESYSESKTKFAYGAGIQITPVANWAIDIGYEGTKIYEARVDGFNIGVGYRF
ncbi:outer membrane beta-barrel protein [Pectobacterium atrosepticum]|nr:outer membrane beta-barrel protein [Pectobacterium atrosepticum]POW25691.1 virulence protein [Pectobacterium atrosepticum]